MAKSDATEHMLRAVDRLGPLFRELDLTLSATQYVVQRPEQIAERRRRDGAILDYR